MKENIKKVLFTATVDSHILHFHIPYLKMFKDKGYEVHVATNGDANIPYCDVKHVVSFERSPFSVNNLKAIKQLKKIIEKEKFDVIHCHTPMGSVVTRIAASHARKAYKTRVIYTAHGFHFYKGAPLLNWMLFYPVEKILSYKTDDLITINKEDYEFAKKKMKAKRIHYVPGVGVDPEKFSFQMSEDEKDKLRQEVGISKDDFVLICVGELNDNKNQIMQIEAIRELVKENNNIKLLLAGDGDKKEFLQEKIREYNLEENVKLLGYRKDIPRLFQISNVAISTSKREGLPVNIIEAQICDLPCIVTDCRGNRDLVQDGINGYLINIGDSKRLHDCINRIYLSNMEENKSDTRSQHIEEYLLEKIGIQLANIYFSRKKVLHVLSSNKYSGAENVACTIIENLNKNYECYYCCPKGPIEKTLKEKNINYIALNKMNLIELKKVINNVAPDVIHAHDNKASVLCSLLKKNAKLISHIHGNNKIMNTINLKTILFNYCTKKIDRIIWVSNSSFDGYVFNKNVKEKSMILYNVVDSQTLHNKSNLYKIDEKYDLIFLGRLAYPKNPQRLIKIVSEIKKLENDIKVAVVGDGEDRVQVEELIKQYKLEENIVLYGFKDNPYPILNNSKLLIMTSIYEGTPMCALEAQAFGKPIIATPVDGLKKIVINDFNGFLSDKDEELASKAVQIISDEKELKKLSDNTQKYFTEYNDINKYIENIRKEYGD